MIEKNYCKDTIHNQRRHLIDYCSGDMTIFFLYKWIIGKVEIIS